MNITMEGWSVGLFDCCAAPGGCSRCCEVCLCPCIVYGQLAASAPPNIVTCVGPTGCRCCCPCLLYWAFYGLTPGAITGGGTLAQCAAPFWYLACVGTGGYLLEMPLRATLRPPGTKETPLESWLISTFCSSCALCQMSNELDIQGGWKKGARGAEPPARRTIAPQPVVITM